MKRIFAVVIVLSCIVQFACKKKSNNAIGYSVKPPKGLDTLVSLSAKINGENWRTDSVYAYKPKSVIDTTNTNLTITASQITTPASTITFTIINYKGPNTYIIDPPYVSAAYYLGNLRHFASSGQVIVSSDDEYGIIGVFNFTADSIDVTQGVFNAAQP